MAQPTSEVNLRFFSSRTSIHQCRNTGSQWTDPDTKIFPRVTHLYVQAYMGRAFTTKGPSTVDYLPSRKLTN